MAEEKPRLGLIERYAERFKGLPQTFTVASPLTKDTAQPPPPQGGVLTIDRTFLRHAGYIVPDGDKTRLSEEMRIIKQRLLRKIMAGTPDSGDSHLVMVTSARPGEGKTFVAVNLALSMASERDLQVILADTDIYTQSAQKVFGIDTEAMGLLNLLLDDTLTLRDALLPTSIENFSILPAGRRHPSAAELFASQRMNDLTAELVSRYPKHVVVLDSPPLLASTETSVLATHVGQIVIVVEGDRTPWRLLERSMALIDNCPNIAFVLNKVEPAMGSRDYGTPYRDKPDGTAP